MSQLALLSGIGRCFGKIQNPKRRIVREARENPRILHFERNRLEAE